MTECWRRERTGSKCWWQTAHSTTLREQRHGLCPRHIAVADVTRRVTDVTGDRSQIASVAIRRRFNHSQNRAAHAGLRPRAAQLRPPPADFACYRCSRDRRPNRPSIGLSSSYIATARAAPHLVARLQWKGNNFLPKRLTVKLRNMRLNTVYALIVSCRREIALDSSLLSHARNSNPVVTVVKN